MVDAEQNLFGAGCVATQETECDLAVVKMDGDTGEELWRFTVPSPRGYGSATHAALDSSGNVVVLGQISTDAAPTVGAGEPIVLKLSSATGELLWTWNYSPVTGCSSLYSLDLNANGDILVAGSAKSADGPLRSRIAIKIAGSNGAELWRQLSTAGAPPTGYVEARFDNDGDVLATGSVRGGDVDAVIAKMDGSNGEPLWQKQVGGVLGTDDGVASLVADSNGDAIISLLLDDRGTVMKFAGDDGEEQWRQSIDGSDGWAIPIDLDIDVSGNPVLTGFVQNYEPRDSDWLIAKFNGASGAVVWRRDLNGNSAGRTRYPGSNSLFIPRVNDQGLHVIIDPSGDVISGGSLFARAARFPHSTHFAAVVKLNRDRGY